MNTSMRIRVATAVVILVGALSPAALAGGEPKNEWPFTRAVADHSLTQTQGSQAVVGQGEAKNDFPFTQIVDVPVVGESGGGFDWGDAGIGVAAGIGIAALVAGGLLLVYRGPRGRGLGAAATR